MEDFAFGCLLHAQACSLLLSPNGSASSLGILQFPKIPAPSLCPVTAVASSSASSLCAEPHTAGFNGLPLQHQTLKEFPLESLHVLNFRSYNSVEVSADCWVTRLGLVTSEPWSNPPLLKGLN